MYRFMLVFVLVFFSVSCSTYKKYTSYPPQEVVRNAAYIESIKSQGMGDKSLKPDTRLYSYSPIGSRLKDMPKPGDIQIPDRLTKKGFTKQGFDFTWPCQPLSKCRGIAYNRAVRKIVNSIPGVVKTKTLTGSYEQNGRNGSFHRVYDIITLSAAYKLETEEIEFGFLDEDRGIGIYVAVAGKVLDQSIEESGSEERSEAFSESDLFERTVISPEASERLKRDENAHQRCISSASARNLINEPFWPIDYNLPEGFRDGRHLISVNGKYYLIESQINAEDAVQAASFLIRQEMDKTFKLTLDRIETYSVCGQDDFVIAVIALGWER